MPGRPVSFAPLKPCVAPFLLLTAPLQQLLPSGFSAVVDVSKIVTADEKPEGSQFFPADFAFAVNELSFGKQRLPCTCHALLPFFWYQGVLSVSLLLSHR